MINDVHKYKTVKSLLICDKCESIIGSVEGVCLEDNHRGINACNYRDLNRGHECMTCRKERRHAYDRYVIGSAQRKLINP